MNTSFPNVVTDSPAIAAWLGCQHVAAERQVSIDSEIFRDRVVILWDDSGHAPSMKRDA